MSGVESLQVSGLESLEVSRDGKFRSERGEQWRGGGGGGLVK